MNLRLSAVFSLLASAAAFAQAPTGEIAGTVYDASGAVVPNAAITLKSAATGFTREIRSNHSGRYSAPSLAAGAYELRAEAAGFRNVALAVTVATGSVNAVDLHLQVGEHVD